MWSHSPAVPFRADALTKDGIAPSERLKARITKLTRHITQQSAICCAGRLLQCWPKVVHAAPRLDMRGLLGNGFPAPFAIEVIQGEPLANENPRKYAYQRADTA